MSKAQERAWLSPEEKARRRIGSDQVFGSLFFSFTLKQDRQGENNWNKQFSGGPAVEVVGERTPLVFKEVSWGLM